MQLTHTEAQRLQMTSQRNTHRYQAKNSWEKFTKDPPGNPTAQDTYKLIKA